MISILLNKESGELLNELAALIKRIPAPQRIRAVAQILSGGRHEAPAPPKCSAVYDGHPTRLDLGLRPPYPGTRPSRPAECFRSAPVPVILETITRGAVSRSIRKSLDGLVMPQKQ